MQLTFPNEKESLNLEVSAEGVTSMRDLQQRIFTAYWDAIEPNMPGVKRHGHFSAVVISLGDQTLEFAQVQSRLQENPLFQVTFNIPGRHLAN